jgi:xanthine dehydrogenase accessory factor
MRTELLQLAAELGKKGEPFVLAMVVRREAYSSAQQGDMAVIAADGTYHGWLGGNCTRPSVRKEALRALADGKPRLVSLSPEPDPHPRPGVTALPMTCHSGGTVEIYLEPMLPRPRMLLFGLSPVVRALSQLGQAMGWAVDVCDPGAEALALPGSERRFQSLAAPELRAYPPGTVSAVVATMGENDEDAVQAALEARPAYLGVVASRKRFAVLRETLLARGIAAEQLGLIRSPAGLDLGARLPEEVALSILAEVVKERRSVKAAGPVQLVPAPPPEPEALDPICGMTVVIATARHKGQWGGRDWYFCNARCKDKFLADPQKWLPAAAEPAR